MLGSAVILISFYSKTVKQKSPQGQEADQVTELEQAKQVEREAGDD